MTRVKRDGPLHIGIVACSTEGAALCYRTISAEGAKLLGPHDHPDISLHSHSLAQYMRCIDRDDWGGVAGLMLSSVERVAGCGANFAICPDNTIHRVMADVRAKSPIPWLHIAEVVAAEAARREFKKIAVLGTRYLVESEVYPEALGAAGIGFLRPDAADRETVNRIIFDELVYGVFDPRSREAVCGVIARMREQGCDAAVLGCTEIPLIISDENSALPTLDSTRLLARAALARAVYE